MSNFGFKQLRLVKPYDAAFREARSAVRSQYILERAKVFDDLASAVADCSLIVGTTAADNRDLHAPLHRLEAAAPLIQEHRQSGAVALLFGSEKFGLSNDDLSHCHWLLRIPARQEHGSMNLGQAVAVCLFELQRNVHANSRTFPSPTPANAGQMALFTELLLDCLEKSGYTNRVTSSSTELKIMRLVRRLPLPAADAATWLGILRQIRWKLDQTTPK